MKLTIKLNIEEFQNLDCETNEYEEVIDCYTEILDFLDGWIDYTPKAVRLRNHIRKLLAGKTGEKSAPVSESGEIPVNTNVRDSSKADSTPLPQTVYPAPVGRDKMPSAELKTTVVETQNFVDVRECIDYTEKSYKLVGYDQRETYIAKQHVIRTESIEGGGTRVVVSTKSAWVITKLEWK